LDFNNNNQKIIILFFFFLNIFNSDYEEI